MRNCHCLTHALLVFVYKEVRIVLLDDSTESHEPKTVSSSGLFDVMRCDDDCRVLLRRQVQQIVPDSKETRVNQIYLSSK